MKGIYIVTKIIDKKVVVSPALSPGQNGKASGAHLTARNRRGFSIKEGSKVQLGFSKGFEGFQGVAALVGPVFVCGASILLFPRIFSRLNIHPAEPLRFLFALFIFLLSVVIVKKLERRTCTILEPEIISVLG